jgi:MerR family transcriptional regulator, thiopeptide resistance regulator
MTGTDTTGTTGTSEARTWKIGEVATATGLTARALHHYDEIGLVSPSARTAGGHRLYTVADLQALYRVTAMRQLGLSLEQIGRLLEQRVGVREVIDEQLEQVDRQLQAAARLRRQLLEARERTAEPDGLLAIIQLTQDVQGYLSPEQIQAMHRRVTGLGVVAQHAIGVEMPRLYAEAQRELRAGTPATDPAVRRIADRLDELAKLLRGDDERVGAAVRGLWLAKGRQRPEEFDSRDWADLVAYLDQSRATRGDQ